MSGGLGEIVSGMVGKCVRLNWDVVWDASGGQSTCQKGITPTKHLLSLFLPSINVSVRDASKRQCESVHVMTVARFHNATRGPGMLSKYAQMQLVANILSFVFGGKKLCKTITPGSMNSLFSDLFREFRRGI